ncbi:cupin domain-containing protein [Lysobacter capsici]|uniref:JmjC domain-containing protein n=1 Tax=Lysobacter capsici TaxID=435897 RepID=UPI00177B1010|nr:cupin domain-containing protein [Lysobacter capsici]UOF17382.1 cupin domain-containing protein [Lysobacter capsici]
MSTTEYARLFEGLVAPLSAQEFKATAWPAGLHISHEVKPGLAALLAQPELRDIESFCAIGNDGGIHINYTREERFRIELNADPAHAIEQFHAGNTIQILDLKTDEIRRWNRALDAALGLIPGTTLVNAFTSLRGKGIPWHWDSQEVFVVQVRGRKLWHVAPNDYVEWPTLNGMPTPSPSREMAFQLKDPTQPILEPEQWRSVEMLPGSVMYMPRGYWHKVEQNLEESLHLVLQVRLPSWRDLFRFMLDNAPPLYDLDWRRPTSALSPDNLATMAPREFKERLESLERLAGGGALMAMAQQFSSIIDGGGLYKDIAPQMKY